MRLNPHGGAQAREMNMTAKTRKQTRNTAPAKPIGVPTHAIVEKSTPKPPPKDNPVRTPLTFAQAEAVLAEAKSVLDSIQHTPEVKAFVATLLTYGRKIGYKPVIKGCLLGKPTAEALKAYRK
jgi:hypothetical protein